MYTNPRRKAGQVTDDVREAIERRFEYLRQRKADEETLRIDKERMSQPSNPWLYFTIVREEGRFHLPSDYVFDIVPMFKQIAHYVDSDCEEYLIEKWPIFNIGTLKVLLFLMEQSDEKPNVKAITGLVTNVEEYLDKSDAHLENYLVELPVRESTWEGNKTLEIFKQLITRLEKRLERQPKDAFDVENLFMTIFQKRQQSKEHSDEPARKRCRSASM